MSNPPYEVTISPSHTVIQRIEFGLYDPPPQPDLVAPAAGSDVDADLGYVDVRWSDPSGAAGGIDTTTLGPMDITIESGGR